MSSILIYLSFPRKNPSKLVPLSVQPVVPWKSLYSLTVIKRSGSPCRLLACTYMYYRPTSDDAMRRDLRRRHRPDHSTCLRLRRDLYRINALAVLAFAARLKSPRESLIGQTDATRSVHTHVATGTIYTVFQKTKPPNLGSNFVESQPIFKILSLTDSAGNLLYSAV